MLRTIIVEDEPLSRLYLTSLLGDAYPDIAVIGGADTEEEAVRLITGSNPDLIFLDIELQSGTGFGVIRRIPASTTGHIIFTTALDQHATNVLRLAGVPYIQKPIDAESLLGAVDAVRNPVCTSHHILALSHLHNTLQNGLIPRTFFVSVPGHHEYVAMEEIVSIESRGAEGMLKLRTGRDVLTQYSLKDLDGLLCQFGFFRTHMNHIINRAYAGSPGAMQGVAVRMLDGSEVPLSPKKEPALRDYLRAGERLSSAR